MKIRIEEKAKGAIEEPEVVIYCYERTKEINAIESYVKAFGCTLTGVNGQHSCQLKPEDIFYFEVVDGKTFAYLQEAVWQVSKSLEALESMLGEGGTLEFFRVSKSCLINMYHVEHFTSTVGSRIVATMENKEKVVISRHFAKQLRAYMKTGKE